VGPAHTIDTQHSTTKEEVPVQDHSGHQIVTEHGRWAQVPLWVVEVGLSASAVRMYVALHNWADREGESYPSHGKIAKYIGCSASSVKRAIGDLIEAGALRSEERFKGSGEQSSNLYTLMKTPPKMNHPQVINELPPQVKSELPPSSKMTYKTRTNYLEPKELTIEPVCFDQFWAALPPQMKKGKAVAKRKWERMGHDTRQAALDGIAPYVGSVSDPQFLKHGSTYVNQRTWEDFDDGPVGRTGPAVVAMLSEMEAADA